jgi:hypothetical protein
MRGARGGSLATKSGKFAQKVTSKFAAKKVAAGWVCIRPRVLGVPPGALVSSATLEANRCDPFIASTPEHDNNVKELETLIFGNAFVFNVFVAGSRLQVLYFLARPTGPVDGYPVDSIPLSHPKRHRQFRLR